MAILLILGAFMFLMSFIHRFPRIIRTTMLWAPPPPLPGRPIIVIIEMGYNESFPQLWRSMGCFINDLADANITVIHYRDVTPRSIAFINPAAVVLTGYHQDLSIYNQEEMRGFSAFLKSTIVPVLGICGGHQFIGLAFGSKIVEMGFEERGYLRITPRVKDPIYNGLSGSPLVFDWHSLKLDRIPDQFKLLGDNEHCIQAMRHERKPIYGVQFHPEFTDRAHPDSILMVENFLRLAGIPLLRVPLQ
jgi:GMP synthase-like glutamine amidotransferase